jgi:hypothetical protein
LTTAAGNDVATSRYGALVSPQRTRRQHTAAKAYLRGFADAADHVCMHARSGAVGERNIASASVARDFYTFEDDAGVASDAVERWFSAKIENSVAGALRGLQAGSELKREWMPMLPPFVVSSLLRTATVRSFMDQIDGHTRPLLVLLEQASRLRLDLAAMSERERRTLLGATRAAVARVETNPREERMSSLRTMVRKIDEWATMLAAWSWELLHDNNATLITGDAPVVVLGATPILGWAGVLPPQCTVAVPITPHSVLLASPLPLIGPGLLTSQLAKQLNNDLVRNCFKAVFHHPTKAWPVDLDVPPHPSRLAEPTITWRRSPPGTPMTFPTSYPAVQDETIRSLLTELNATDEVR